MPARVVGQRPGGGRAELLFVQPEPGAEDRRWTAWGKPAKRLVGRTLSTTGGDLVVTDRSEDGAPIVERADQGPLTPWLELHGAMPLPPIWSASRRSGSAGLSNRLRHPPGAVAAPTAGLHLSERLPLRWRTRVWSAQRSPCTSDLALFSRSAPRTLGDRELVPEYSVVSREVAEAVAQCQARHGRVIAVGTTVVRTLERAAQLGGGRVVPMAEFNGLYIYPGGHRFQVVDALLTNFHLPDSSLIQLVAAFAGTARTQAAYAHALADTHRAVQLRRRQLIEPLAESER